LSATIITWEQFKSAAAVLRASTQSRNFPYLFRGQACAAWDLSTTLERSGHSLGLSDYFHLILRIKNEIEVYTGQRWHGGVAFPELDETLTSFDQFSFAPSESLHFAYMSYLRHHSFPSPLLDWSFSPFVAAFFAFRDPTSEFVSIHAYCERPNNSWKLSGSDDPQIRLFGPRIAAHKRHFAQQSQYTICVQWDGTGWRFQPHSLIFDAKDHHGNPPEQDVCRKFILRADERPKVLRELNDYNLNAFSLFGSEESLMDTLSIRERG
jgi:hypothetical protein